MIAQCAIKVGCVQQRKQQSHRRTIRHQCSCMRACSVHGESGHLPLPPGAPLVNPLRGCAAARTPKLMPLWCAQRLQCPSSRHVGHHSPMPSSRRRTGRSRGATAGPSLSGRSGARAAQGPCWLRYLPLAALAALPCRALPCIAAQYAPAPQTPPATGVRVKAMSHQMGWGVTGMQ
jgi:hypothetical protein